jgi:hypothetical protein
MSPYISISSGPVKLAEQANFLENFLAASLTFMSNFDKFEI